VSPLDPEIPPAGEEIHLPGPSLLPILTAFGLTLLVIGLTTFLILSIAGGLILIICIAQWIKDTRRDIDELPLDVPTEL
jgi:hypothetical protein